MSLSDHLSYFEQLSRFSQAHTLSFTITKCEVGDIILIQMCLRFFICKVNNALLRMEFRWRNFLVCLQICRILGNRTEIGGRLGREERIGERKDKTRDKTIHLKGRASFLLRVTIMNGMRDSSLLCSVQSGWFSESTREKDKCISAWTQVIISTKYFLKIVCKIFNSDWLNCIINVFFPINGMSDSMFTPTH